MTLMALYFQNLREFLDYQPQVVSGPLPVPPLETLEFCHVDFTYPGTDRRVLHDVNFTLRQGETLAVVGINGAGKSTLVKLLLRFTTLPVAKFSITASRCRNMTWSSCGLPLAPCSRIIKTLPCPSTRM